MCSLSRFPAHQLMMRGFLTIARVATRFVFTPERIGRLVSKLMIDSLLTLGDDTYVDYMLIFDPNHSKYQLRRFSTVITVERLKF